MPIDDIVEGFLRISGRYLVRFLLEILFEIFCYWIGWAFLKIITLGSYSPGDFEDSSSTVCSLIGLVVFVAAIGVIVYFSHIGWTL